VHSEQSSGEANKSLQRTAKAAAELHRYAVIMVRNQFLLKGIDIFSRVLLVWFIFVCIPVNLAGNSGLN